MKKKLLSIFLIIFLSNIFFLNISLAAENLSCCICTKQYGMVNFWETAFYPISEPIRSLATERGKSEELFITDETECTKLNFRFTPDPGEDLEKIIRERKINTGMSIDRNLVRLVRTCKIEEDQMCLILNTETPVTEPKPIIESSIVLGIKIPDLKFSVLKIQPEKEGSIYISWIAEYLEAIYNFVLIIINIIAVVVIIVAGAQIIVSAGGPTKAAGYKKITNAVIGLFIAWGSFIILHTINPNLAILKSLEIQQIANISIVEGAEAVANLPEALSPGDGIAPDFKQFDAKWANIPFGPDPTCSTIQAAGCGPTSLAAVLTGYGATNASPDKVAAFAGIRGNGRICNSGVNIHTTISKLSQSEWSNFTGKKITLDNALQLLEEKKSIIFLCNKCTGTTRKGPKTLKGGHYMVLTSVDEQGNITVNDPGGNRMSGIILMTKEQLKNNNGFWYVHPK